MTHLLLVRHGETDWNAQERIQGHTPTSLNANGRAQAELLTKRLASVPLTAIYSSDLPRARETAEAVAATHNLSVHIDEGLRERSFGQWEGLTAEDLHRDWADAWARWKTEGDTELAPPGGEAWAQVQTRFLPVITRILNAHPAPEDTVLIAGHGGSLRLAVLFALDAPLVTLRRLRLDNTSLTRIEFPPAPRPPRLVTFNDTAHLDTLP